jgi:sulfur-carrier protein adenylyltransferase/sulfurtransferase
MNRYARQIVLPEVGAEGQARLTRSSVLVIGAGGLGCAVLQYLCAAGIGRLTIVDHDRVELTNLHRQPLYRTGDSGRFKVEAAAAALAELNPDILIEGISARLTPANAITLVAAHDVIVDAADSFAVTYALSDECLSANKPLISASVIGMSGYAGAFCGGGPSYRAVFPDLPAHAGSCAESGVLGTAVGVLGTLQAHLVLALLLRTEPAVLGRLLTVDLSRLRFGGFSFHGAPEPVDRIPFIAPSDLTAADRLIDVRTQSIEELDRMDASRTVLCCRSGLRAWRAAKQLQARGHRQLALLALGDS